MVWGSNPGINRVVVNAGKVVVTNGLGFGWVSSLGLLVTREVRMLRHASMQKPKYWIAIMMVVFPKDLDVGKYLEVLL